MTHFECDTPLGQLDLDFPHEGFVHLRLYNFEFEGQAFSFFEVPLRYQEGLWLKNSRTTTLIASSRRCKDKALKERLLDQLEDVFLQWWAVNKVEVRREGLARDKERLCQDIEREQDLITKSQETVSKYQAEIEDLDLQIAALPNPEKALVESDTAVAQLLNLA